MDVGGRSRVGGQRGAVDVRDACRPGKDIADIAPSCGRMIGLVGDDDCRRIVGANPVVFHPWPRIEQRERHVCGCD